MIWEWGFLVMGIGGAIIIYYIAHDIGFTKGERVGRDKANKSFDDALMAAQLDLFRREFRPPTVHPFEDRSSIPQGPTHGNVQKPDMR